MMKKSLCVFLSLAVFPALAFLVPENSAFRLNAQVRDVYQWSDKKEKYNLEKIVLDFKVQVLSDSAGISQVVQNGQGVDKPAGFARFMSVHGHDEVRFETPPVFKADDRSMFDENDLLFQDPKAQPLKQAAFRARLSEDKEKLSVYFADEEKNGVLIGMLYQMGFVLPLHNMKEQITSSDYQCRVKNSKFFCTIDYVLESDLGRLLEILPENDKLYQKLVKPFKSFTSPALSQR